MTDTWTWATVTQATPLRIKVDGDTTALDATTDDLVGSLAVDDRVRVHLHSDGIIVTGIQGGNSVAQDSNGNVELNGRFHITDTTDVNPYDTSDSAFMIGDPLGYSVHIDNNELAFKSGGGVSKVRLYESSLNFSTDEDALLLEMSSNVVEYSGGLAPRLYRKGEVVMISGGIKPANSGAASDFNGYSPTNICKIPASLQPRFGYAMHSIQQGSGKDRWNLALSGDWLCGSRYGPGTPSTGTWFPFSITYII